MSLIITIKEKEIGNLRSQQTKTEIIIVVLMSDNNLILGTTRKEIPTNQHSNERWANITKHNSTFWLFTTSSQLVLTFTINNPLTSHNSFDRALPPSLTTTLNGLIFHQDWSHFKGMWRQDSTVISPVSWCLPGRRKTGHRNLRSGWVRSHNSHSSHQFILQR